MDEKIMGTIQVSTHTLRSLKTNHRTGQLDMTVELPSASPQLCCISFDHEVAGKLLEGLAHLVQKAGEATTRNRNTDRDR